MAFFKADPEAWLIVLGTLPRPVIEEVAVLDLAYWQNEVTREARAYIPGISALAGRWGWTHWKARRLVETHKNRMELTQKPHRNKRAEPDNEPEAAQKPHGTHTRTARSGGAPSPLGKEEKKEEDSVWEFWRTLALPDGTQPHKGARCLRKEDRPHISARIKTDGAATTMLVLEWGHGAAEAEFAYWGKGYTGIYTLLKPKGWDHRVESAKRWAKAGKHTDGQPDEATLRASMDCR